MTRYVLLDTHPSHATRESVLGSVSDFDVRVAVHTMTGRDVLGHRSVREALLRHGHVYCVGARGSVSVWIRTACGACGGQGCRSCDSKGWVR